MTKILLCIDWFYPAYKAGGPIRSAVNFIEHFHQQYDIYVLTGASDLNETKPMEGVVLDAWTDFNGKARVFYASEGNVTMAFLQQQIESIQPAHIYLQSVFSRRFTIYPLWLKWRGKIKATMVLAPRGMLKASALAFKPFKKKIFLSVFQLLKMDRQIRFQATDEQERKDILRHFPKARVILAPNLPGAVAKQPYPIIKVAGTIRILFVGRVHPIKNLHRLLETIGTVKGAIQLSIIGMKESESYWQQCEQLIAGFPASVQVQFLGEQPHEVILQQLQRHHIFALPTQGENFGHAIFESLSTGRPVLISDQTPWRNLLAHQAGWDIALQEPASFSAALQTAVDWDQETFDRFAQGALQVASGFLTGSNDIKNYHLLFN